MGHSGKRSTREGLAIFPLLEMMGWKEQSVLNWAPAHFSRGLGLLLERLSHTLLFLPVSFFLRNNQNKTHTKKSLS